ncbi:hypothetical protein Dimus_013544 [Dionaea muscipula]
MESTIQHKLPQELEVENPQELVAELPQQTDGHEKVTAMKQKRGRTMKQGIHVRGLEDPLKKDRAKVNALNRAKVTNVHTCGPKSFALIRERLKNANEDKKEPTSVEMFKATVKRVIGRVYKAPIENTQNKIVQMKALQSQQCGENVESVDPFVVVLGNEHRVKLYGRGVTSSSIRKTSSGNESGGNKGIHQCSR